MLCGLYGVLVDLGCVVVGDMRPQLIQRQVPAAHTVIHGQHFQRLGCDPRRIVENVGDHVHRPAVAQHFISLGIRHGEYVVLRHRLEALALQNRQFSDDVEAVGQLYGGSLSFYGYLTAQDLIDWICTAARLCLRLDRVQPSLCPHATALAAQGHAFTVRRVYPVLLAVEVGVFGVSLNGSNADRLRNAHITEFPICDNDCG